MGSVLYFARTFAALACGEPGCCRGGYKLRRERLPMRVRVLSEDQIKKLHDGSIEILSTVGVHIPHEEMRERFRGAGAQVDETAGIVKIPQEVVMRCVESAGKAFTIYGRDRSKQAVFGAGQRNYNSIAGEALWVEDGAVERRYATLDDVRTAAILGDALKHVNIVGAMADPKEIPAAYRCVAVAATQLKHTTKPITFWFHDRASAKYVLELFAAVAGSEAEAARYPFGYPFLEPISPLKLPKDGVDLLFETSRFPLPVPIGPMAQVGLSAPGTLAGTLCQENAEILAGVCVTQLIRPGTPVCYGGIPHAFDMHSMQMIFSGPEQALMAVAMTQMGKSYGLPVYINVGLTDSKVADAQAGLEAGITLACGAMAGADIFGHLGICGVDLGSSLSILVMQDEIIGYVERIMRDIDVSDEAMGLDVIRTVARTGSYIAEPHTVAHFRKELWFPKLLDRQFWEPWVEGGAKDMRQRCIEAKEHLLRTHQPVPMDADTEREVDRIVDAARRHLGGEE